MPAGTGDTGQRYLVAPEFRRPQGAVEMGAREHTSEEDNLYSALDDR